MKKPLIVCLFAFITTLFGWIHPGIGSELICTYDELNRLERVEKAGKYIIEYSYDTVGNRILKIIVITQFSSDSDGDKDVDGIDLDNFISNWDGNLQSLSDFANRFGEIK